MANPFLMLDDDIPEVGGFGEPEPINDPTSNPFLMAQASQDNIDYGDIENPFSQATNPFAGFGDSSGVAEEEPAANAIFDPQSTEPNVSEVATKVYKSHERNAAAMSFFHTTITDDDDDHLEDPELSKHAAGHEESTQGLINISDNESNNKKPPPRPVPPATQELILTVADQLDQTSSHLLGRLPVTRTPSPVNMRDLHTPSPTPDNLVDLLDISDDQKHHIEPDLLGNHMDDDNSNPFGVPVVAEKHPPHRPEPPHVHHGPPPPRPVPPPVTHPHPVEPVTQEPDLFDMFGDNAPKRPPPPKTKEDILSLFSPKPAEVIKPDLLSDDIIHVSPPVVHPATPMPQDASQQSVATNAFAEDISIQRNQENFEEMNIMNPLSPELSTQVEQLSDSPKVKYTDVEKENILDESDKAEVMSDISAADSTIFNSPNPNVVMEEIVETVPKRQSPEVIQPAITHPARPPPPAVVPRISPEANPFASDVNAPTEAPVSHITHSPARPPPPAPPKRTIVPAPSPVPAVMPVNTNVFADIAANDEFDAFAAKFESVKKEEPNTLGVGGPFSGAVTPTNESAWGDDASFGDGSTNGFDDGDGFGNDDGDAFMSMGPPQIQRSESRDSDDEKDFTFSIRPIDANSLQNSATPVLAPPPRTSQNNSIYSADSPPRVNPFDSTGDYQVAQEQTAVRRTDSQETPPTPLFDDDISQPLEEFPRISYTGSGWEMQLRQPNKKKITGQRFWKKIYLRLVYQGDTPVCQLYNLATDKTPFQELPLQACYSVSEISAQQFDQFGKIFTLKLQYIFYKERPGVRPGQVTKAERITSKLSQFAAYAIQGDYQGVKEFGSDLKKLGLPVEHAPQITQLFKIGSMNYEDLKQFSVCIEEALFKMSVHRDRALNYKMEEVQVTAVDELYVEQDADGHILKQIARVRLFFLAFLSGMPTIELGVNDMWRQGKEVVGRHDIIPVETEEWIRLEGVEYNSVVQLDEYDRTRIIRFQPPDANYIELMRFRVRPPRNRELPLQLKATWVVTGNKVELRADILVPGFASRKLGQIPCEDVSVRFPIPECWIYLFRVEKHFRYGSVKSAHRRTGKIKGIERILGTVDTLQESLIEVTSGQAKYEHHHRAIVWRCPRLPKEGQGAYTTHQMVVRMALTSYDQIPEQLAPYCYVEFTMPATVVSHFTVRSVSVQDSDSDDPPEKYVRYLARNEYKVAIEHTTGDSVNPYLAATAVSKQPIREEPTPQPAPSPSPMVGSDSDSDSN